ncbi:hypothetical protein [Pararhizobium sp.]|uniref:hypothetical protein n=1 Tax=Pararhizobium sp. TaxID=1977563 RepID=UPI003BAA0D71
MIVKFIKTFFRFHFTATTSEALGGVSKSLAKLRKAADNHDRRAVAADRLVERFVTISADEAKERDRAHRVADRLEDLIA